MSSIPFIPFVSSFVSLKRPQYWPGTFMDIEKEKLQLIKKILETKDGNMLAQIRNILDSKEEIWDTLPDEVKASVERAIQQADTEQLIPHEQAIGMLKKWH